MKKFSKKLIYYRLIYGIFVALIVYSFVFSTFVGEEEEISIELMKLASNVSLILAIIAYIILVVYNILYYKLSAYELKENEIVCVRGVLFKKKSIVEYKKIHAINSKQNFIEKMFKVSTLQVDSGSTNTAHSAEIQIIEDELVVEELMKIIKAKQNGEELYTSTQDYETSIEQNNNETLKSIYDFTSKRKVIYTLLQISVIVVVSIISIIVLAIILGILRILNQVDTSTFITIIGVAMLIFVAIEVIGFVFGLIGSLLNYHNFNLIRTKNNIEVSYGLVTRVNNSFKYNKIRAIRITQSLIQRIFGFSSIRVEVIGYTVETNNEDQSYSAGILVPLCKTNEVNSILNALLPNYIPEERKYKAKEYKPFYSYFLIFSIIVAAFAQIALIVFLGYFKLPSILLVSSLILWGVYLIFVAIVLIDRRLAYKNAGFSLKDSKLTIFRGSFTKEIIVMRRQNIIGIDAKTTYFRKKKNIYSYKVHFRTNSFSNTVNLLNLDKSEGDEMYKLIRY